MVLNRIPFPPDKFIELSTTSDKTLICKLQGVTFAPVDAIPINGFEKSSVVNPTPVSYTHLTLPTNREV